MSRAAVLTGPRRVDVVDVAGRAPGEGEVAVALDGCGVCGSNLPVWQGRPWFEYPLPAGAPGHEAWGWVEAAGDGAGAGAAPGAPVAVLAEAAFAERVVVPARDVVPLPAALAGQPFPGEAYACAWNAARRSRFAPGERVAVVGTGFLGSLLVALASHAGAHVVAISRRPASLDVARDMGADETVALHDADLVRAAGPCDVVVDAAGVQEALDVATDLVAEGGRIVIAGYHQDGLRTVDLQTWNWKGVEVVNAHERDRDVVRQALRDAARAIVYGDVDVAPLLTHEVPLDRIADAMRALDERPPGFVKAVVRT